MPGRFTPPTPDRLSPQCAIRALTKRAGLVAGAGWTTSPAGLSMTIVDVLKTDSERNVLALGLGGRRRRRRERHALAGARLVLGEARGAVEPHDFAGFDQALNARARKAGFESSGRAARN